MNHSPVQRLPELVSWRGFQSWERTREERNASGLGRQNSENRGN